MSRQNTEGYSTQSLLSDDDQIPSMPDIGNSNLDLQQWQSTPVYDQWLINTSQRSLYQHDHGGTASYGLDKAMATIDTGGLPQHFAYPTVNMGNDYDCHSMEIPSSFEASDDINEYLSSISANTMTSNQPQMSIITRKLTKKLKTKPYEPGFVPHKWQDGINRGRLSRLYQALTNQWPKDIPDTKRARYDFAISKYLDQHPWILSGLLKGSVHTWKQTLEWASIENMNIRSKRKEKAIYKPRNPDVLSPYAWLASKMTKDDKDYIFARLRQYWRVQDPVIYQRLLYYVGLFYKIQSPEPLLQPGQELFEKAADIIWSSSNKKGERHPESGPDDILHRYSPKYSVTDVQGQIIRMPYMREKARASSARFKNEYQWMDHASFDEMKMIHGTVSSHWSNKMHHTRKKKLFLKLNELLEGHNDQVEALKNGDSTVGLELAVQLAEHASDLKYPETYFQNKNL